ncbi:GNAT family N-acetyltransferase [Haladaptatus sp. DFWS20]|uniref:GNAT family N-acetyltransferase n=1 Tax=Haladaptatus sp. DFWS20 TaxID=3403467 RepID=UPI003EB8AABC
MKIERLTDRFAILESVALWNDLHPDFALAERLAIQNLYAPVPGVRVTAHGAFDNGNLVGAILTKHLTDPVPGYPTPDVGWVSLFAVDSRVVDLPRVGTDLLSEALSDLRDRGVSTVSFGNDIQKFMPGLPADLTPNYLPMLTDIGFRKTNDTSDLSVDITTPRSREKVAKRLDDLGDVEFGRARSDEATALQEFVASEFSGRWAYQVECTSRVPGGVDDYWVARREDDIVAFARTGTTDSAVFSSCVNWVERYGPAYCGLGPIGVAEDARGDGIGLDLIATVMAEFRDQGYQHMTIDGVTQRLEGYYLRLGFEPRLRFQMLTNEF